MSERPVALVTGASRGIGRAIAIALASSGHDLVITGRTLHEGSAVNPATGNSLPGSLNATAEAVERAGGRAYRVRADILDLDEVEASFERSLAATGGIDVLVNNAVYVGPGNDVPLSEGSPDDIISRVAGNLTAPLLLTRAFLRHVVATGRTDSATIVDITSDAGQRVPDSPAGRGGWSVVYAATKAGFHRIADMVVVEHPTIRAFNVNPGFVATERVLDSGTGLEWVARHGVSPSVIGRAVATMIADPTITNGGYVHAQPYLRERLGDDEYEALLKSAKAGDDDH
jgi:3-oxoacyl-[acyl-carrier protein] reductase